MLLPGSTIRYICPGNVLVANETGSNMHEMGDGNNGGQQCMMSPPGETPRYKANSGYLHFTVVLFTRMTGELDDNNSSSYDVYI